MSFETGTSKLLYEQDGPVAIITINRPEVRNALDNETADALTRALRAFDQDDALRCCVLTGAGGFFCAGADLKALATGQDYRAWAGDPDGPCPTQFLWHQTHLHPEQGCRAEESGSRHLQAQIA